VCQIILKLKFDSSPVGFVVLKDWKVLFITDSVIPGLNPELNDLILARRSWDKRHKYSAASLFAGEANWKLILE